MALKQGIVDPGQRVFCDQYESSVLGRRWDSFGREPDHERYRGGTLFCDGVSTYIHINHQTSLYTGDTLQGKHSFEEFASSVGVKVDEYRADNHIFSVSIPKWRKRSRLGQFLGFSPNHSTKVAMMSNVRTGHISPQFHVVFGDFFSIVSTTFQDPS